VFAHGLLEDFEYKPVLADLELLKSSQIPVLYSQDEIGVGYAVLTPEMQARLQHQSHLLKRCGSFESLEQYHSTGSVYDINFVEALLGDLTAVEKRHQSYALAPFALPRVEYRPEIAQALGKVEPENLRGWVKWFSSFPHRYNKATEPNEFVNQFYLKLEQVLAGAPELEGIDLEMVPHSTTKQQSLRVRVHGSKRPEEIIVLGGHMDSINGSSSSNMLAPGADDNASGSANLIEALRILLEQPRPERTVEFMWYAGEESGLLGSAEIAKAYKEANKKIIAVLQLDMSLFPGSGASTIASMTDYTSPWLRDYLKALNKTYMNINIVEDKCGYGCSDHASWHRQGFPAVMPFEAGFSKMNQDIHTARDLITTKSNFEHSALFTKIALAIALDLGSSQEKQPY
jgi:leucyl aminopeptidase